VSKLDAALDAAATAFLSAVSGAVPTALEPGEFSGLAVPELDALDAATTAFLSAASMLTAAASAFLPAPAVPVPGGCPQLAESALEAIATATEPAAAHVPACSGDEPYAEPAAVPPAGIEDGTIRHFALIRRADEALTVWVSSGPPPARRARATWRGSRLIDVVRIWATDFVTWLECGEGSPPEFPTHLGHVAATVLRAVNQRQPSPPPPPPLLTTAAAAFDVPAAAAVAAAAGAAAAAAAIAIASDAAATASDAAAVTAAVTDPASDAAAAAVA